MRLIVFVLGTSLLVTGCASTKQWSATGGSRADATVKLSFNYGPFEKPTTSEAEAINLATARCKTWGYTGAEAFGGSTQQCTMPGGMGGCSQFTVTKEYQCTGTGTPGQTGN